MHKYLLTLSILMISNFAIAQATQKYSKVRINMIGHEHSELSSLGIECDHGEIAPKKYIINVYDQEELKLIEEAGFEYELIIEDVASYYNLHGTDDHKHVEASAREVECSLGEKEYNFETPENYTFGPMGGYLPYEQALAELDRMHELYPNLITERKVIGDIVTHEGHNLYYLVISDDPDNIIEEEPQIYYTALHHAREPNSLSQLIFYMWYLLENYETNSEVKYLVDNVAMFFQPIVNPDGYIFNEITNPNGGGFWRKNRYANQNGEKVGVDLNRNYGFEWGFDNQGSSPNEDSQTYRGESAFSEPETQATRKLCMDNNFQISLNYHTFGNLLIHPWGYSDQPTDEDSVFKSLGRTMIEDNDFVLGTGTETVGYIVNGDSDDYMYGEQIEKNKSYTFTPEVGPSFWPSQDRIDYFNKSTMRMNLNAAHQLLSFAYAKEIAAVNILTTQQGTLMFELEKSGLKDGLIGFSVMSDTPGVSLSANEYPNLSMTIGETREFEITYNIDPDFTGTQIDFKILIDNGNYVHEKTITKDFDNNIGVPNEVFSDPIESLDNFTFFGEWGLSQNEYVSAPYSVTDSPNGPYQNASYSEIIINDNFDLSNTTNANLKFHTKFEIENDYDFVQLQISTDGIDFNPICGQYTNPGSNDQVENGDPVYDNTQNDWVLETICLDEYVGNEAIVIKFVFQSDNFVTGDGFYFDNLVLETFDGEEVAITEIPANVISIMPNPTNDFIQLMMDPQYFKDNMSFELFDMVGKKLIGGQVMHPNQKIDISQFNPGTYSILFKVENTIFTTAKIIKK